MNDKGIPMHLDQYPHVRAIVEKEQRHLTNDEIAAVPAAEARAYADDAREFIANADRLYIEAQLLALITGKDPAPLIEIVKMGLEDAHRVIRAVDSLPDAPTLL
jgi:hypothetical protein